MSIGKISFKAFDFQDNLRRTQKFRQEQPVPARRIRYEEVNEGGSMLGGAAKIGAAAVITAGLLAAKKHFNWYPAAKEGHSIPHKLNSFCDRAGEYIIDKASPIIEKASGCFKRKTAFRPEAK